MGRFEDAVEKNISATLPPEILEAIRRAASERRSLYLGSAYVGYFSSSHGSQNIVYIEGWDVLGDTERGLIEIFGSSAALAFDNVYLNLELENSQKEIIFTLGELVDMRSTETGGHVRRVGEYSRLLALKSGMPEEEAQVIGIASAMHDVGKLSIPDEILRKTGRLSRREYDAMKTHAAIGASLLRHPSGPYSGWPRSSPRSITSATTARATPSACRREDRTTCSDHGDSRRLRRHLARQDISQGDDKGGAHPLFQE